MIAVDHIKWTWSTGMSKGFQMFDKRRRGGGVARNDGCVILSVFQVMEQFLAVFWYRLIQVQITHPE